MYSISLSVQTHNKKNRYNANVSRRLVRPTETDEYHNILCSIRRQRACSTIYILLIGKIFKNCNSCRYWDHFVYITYCLTDNRENLYTYLMLIKYKMPKLIQKPQKTTINFDIHIPNKMYKSIFIWIGWIV